MDYKLRGQILFTLIAAIIACANCKTDEWTDSYYNSLLRDDLINIWSDDSIKTNYRVTRDVSELNKTNECNKTSNRQSSSSPSGLNRYQRTCCGESVSDMKTYGETLKTLKKECLGEVTSRKAKQELDACVVETIKKSDVICVMECVNNKKQLIDEKGNIIAEKMRSFVKSEMITQDWQKNVIDPILDKCLKINQGKEKSNNETLQSNDENEEKEENSATTPNSEVAKPNASKCNKSSFKFSQCLWKGLQLSCPQDMIRKTKACQRMRTRLENQEAGKKTKGSKKGKRKNGKRNKNRKQTTEGTTPTGATPASS